MSFGKYLWTKEKFSWINFGKFSMIRAREKFLGKTLRKIIKVLKNFLPSRRKIFQRLEALQNLEFSSFALRLLLFFVIYSGTVARLYESGVSAEIN